MVKRSKKPLCKMQSGFFSLPPKPDVGFGGRLQIQISFEAGLTPSRSPAALLFFIYFMVFRQSVPPIA